jgi:putative addiction module killer protein
LRPQFRQNRSGVLGVDEISVVAYTLQMTALKRTDQFDKWLKGLDVKTRAKILVRLDRLAQGNPGDVRPVGKGVSEMRIHSGPGHRVYYRQHGGAATLLYGGDKASQKADISKAKQIAGELED